MSKVPSWHQKSGHNTIPLPIDTYRPPQRRYGDGNAYVSSRDRVLPTRSGQNGVSTHTHASKPPVNSSKTNRIAVKTSEHHESVPKPPRRPMPKSKYKMGTIIRAPLHEEDSAGGKSACGPDAGIGPIRMVSRSALGDAVHSKYRKLIVISLQHDHYLVLPLYTHNGEGVENRGRHDANEFTSVQDHRADAVRAQLIHPILRTKYLEDHVNHYRSKSTVHFSYPVSRRYALPVIYEGELTLESTDLLRQLFANYIAFGSRRR